MIDTATLQTMQRIVKQRVSSLLDDGYVLMFNTRGGLQTFYKLRHRTNGSFFTIYAYFSRNQIQQYTNGVCVHSAPIWNHPTYDA